MSSTPDHLLQTAAPSDSDPAGTPSLLHEIGALVPLLINRRLFLRGMSVTLKNSTIFRNRFIDFVFIFSSKNRVCLSNDLN